MRGRQHPPALRKCVDKRILDPVQVVEVVQKDQGLASLGPSNEDLEADLADGDPLRGR